MQPYFFPYIGYFQIINIVDKFVIYDDVNYIKNGWINRNKLIISNKSRYVTVPVTNASTNHLINETKIVDYKRFKNKFFKKLKFNYNKAPYYDKIIDLLHKIFNDSFSYIYKFNIRSLQKIIRFLGINTELIISSDTFNNQILESQNRVINICKETNANKYYNLIGGKGLYDKNSFLKENIELYFIRPKNIYYEQFDEKFISHLSIIDILMFNDKEKVSEMLNQFKLI